jgi:hypothetical protein
MRGSVADSRFRNGNSHTWAFLVARVPEQTNQATYLVGHTPVSVNELKVRLNSCQLQSEVHLGDVRVSYISLNHPGVAVRFRIQFGERLLVYLSDRRHRAEPQYVGHGN